MHRLLASLVLLTFMVPRPDMIQQYSLFQQAGKNHDEGNYLKAAELYQNLLATYPDGVFSRETRFNLADTQYRRKKYAEAALLFSTLQKSLKPAGTESRNAWYNEGNALAMQALANTDRSAKQDLLTNALDRYRSVLLADPKNIDARINYEVVSRELEKLLPPPPKSSSQKPDQNDEKENSSPISNEVTNLMLDNTQQEENQLLRKYYRPGKTQRTIKEDKDW